jgi:predicted Zn-ribbon and HTH transcriptional regulator
MIDFLKNIFSPKTLSHETLQRTTLEVHRKEWQKRLEVAVHAAKVEAKKGKSVLIVPDKLLRCQYNMTRNQDDIVKDIEKCFPNCRCVMAQSCGQTFIEVSWK